MNNFRIWLQAEKFGLPIAWKIDTNLAIVLKSNVTLFTELIRDSFVQDTLYINNYLPIIRIESKWAYLIFDFWSCEVSNFPAQMHPSNL